MDINADLGEEIVLNHNSIDERILPYITSANIACGYHAGNQDVMKQTVRRCVQQGVHVGAHPGYFDKLNFGRIETNQTPDEIYTLTVNQLRDFEAVCIAEHAVVHHVKPHGALYHRLISDRVAAKHFMDAVDAVFPMAKIIAFPQSALISCAGNRGLREAFVDRTYLENGQLRPRTEAGAVIEDVEVAANQAITFASKQFADTLCVHGDSKLALQIAKKTHERLKQEGFL
jgi:UPF0271 protein